MSGERRLPACSSRQLAEPVRNIIGVGFYAFGKLPNVTGQQPVLPRVRNIAVLKLGDLAVLCCLGFGVRCFSIFAMAQVTIETIRNGPYIVTGEVELIDADGNKYPVEKRMALCRCGASTEKPFCDGTHSKIGFQAAEKAVPESKE